MSSRSAILSQKRSRPEAAARYPGNAGRAQGLEINLLLCSELAQIFLPSAVPRHTRQPHQPQVDQRVRSSNRKQKDQTESRKKRCRNIQPRMRTSTAGKTKGNTLGQKCPLAPNDSNLITRAGDPGRIARDKNIHLNASNSLADLRRGAMHFSVNRMANHLPVFAGAAACIFEREP